MAGQIVLSSATIHFLGSGGGGPGHVEVTGRDVIWSPKAISLDGTAHTANPLAPSFFCFWFWFLRHESADGLVDPNLALLGFRWFSRVLPDMFQSQTIYLIT